MWMNTHRHSLHEDTSYYTQTETKALERDKHTKIRIHWIHLQGTEKGTVPLNEDAMEGSNRFFIGQCLNHMLYGHSEEPMVKPAG